MHNTSCQKICHNSLENVTINIPYTSSMSGEVEEFDQGFQTVYMGLESFFCLMIVHTSKSFLSILRLVLLLLLLWYSAGYTCGKSH